MASNRLALLRPLVLRSQPKLAPRLSYNQVRNMTEAEYLDKVDPNMNGGYINPPRQKRALRDPYGDWWDKQERRNYGEPVHEDNDILGVFSTEVYNHATPTKAWVSLGAFVAVVLGLCGAVAQLYPDRPSATRTWSDGLEAELGGPTALLASKPGEEEA